MTAQPYREPPGGVDILAEVPAGANTILTPDALAFVAALSRRFAPRVRELLKQRVVRQRAFDRGERPDFLTETREIRAGDWKIAGIPPELRDRRVEITGPAQRKMLINGLNSGARVFMADFEDSQSPTWHNIIDGQLNLRDAIAGTIEYTSSGGRHYTLGRNPAVLIMRPRGWHLTEKHLLVDKERPPAALVDFGLYCYHNAAALLASGSAPYFYLPKLENHVEAQLWVDIFAFAERELAIPPGKIKATILIETLSAAFEMDEILYVLRDYAVGLNCGRWDHIFSFIKVFRNNPDYVLPDRDSITMDRHFLRAYSLLLIKTSHRRGAAAIGGMAAEIPIKGDTAACESAIDDVRADKEREANDGHDGTWVAHPRLVPVATDVFDQLMPESNQIERRREHIQVTAEDLLKVPEGRITEAGLRKNIRVAVEYVGAWLAGIGCVPMDNMMEDASTAEISRAQIWQWIRHSRGMLEDGRRISFEIFDTLLAEELTSLRSAPPCGSAGPEHYDEAAKLLDKITRDEVFADFWTLEAYERLPT